MNENLKTNYTIRNIVDVNINLNYDKLTSKFALENSNIGVWDFHLTTNTVHYSKEAKRILCLDEKHETTFDWKKIIHPEDLDKLISTLKKHYDGEIPNYISEHRVLCSKGKYKWVKDSGRVVERDKLGTPLRIIGTVCDISERKEKEVETVQNLNIITNQNKRLQNFAHIVTHNLKEYTGNFESLLEFYDAADTDEEKEELIKHLKTVSNSLSKTIVNLNEIVSKQSTKKIEREKLNIYQCMEDTFKIMDIEIANKKALIINNVNPEIYIYANRSYMESIIQNLTSNALKYSHPDRKPIINIDSELSEDGILTITVTDNGIGIDLDKYGNDIFGLYRTFHGNKNAEGVGLYLTKSQVETLGGTIEISSQVNVGTTFTITMNIKKNPD
ncbi:PAS domain-containing sensor histidine kinase [Seonamhaeicola sp. S2-3]|uniref:PAS domain-containing sensor histidine kinase n=1 Tax=Seonamhaeicola sp. S2-3 TaxID=1936081 RepID=UPI0009F9A104|nr:PAS domain-containing sensor histidine kinase [Seonamhaeicola sp. S2-3]